MQDTVITPAAMPHTALMQSAFTRAWWVLVIRGLFGIMLGVFAFLQPFTTMHALIVLFGAYAIIDGLFAAGASIRAAEHHMRWWPLLLEGLIGLAAGIFALVMPGVTAIVLVAVAGVWAVMTGVLEIMTAIRLRRHLHNEWLLVVAGALSIIFGFAIVTFPVAGAVWFVLLIGSYALIFGVMFVMLGLRMRQHGHHVVPAVA